MKRKMILFLLLIPMLAFASGDIRPYLQTGPWYPADPQRLGQMLDGFFQSAPLPEKTNLVRGIIAPHAGYEYSGRCASRAYSRLTPAQAIQRVILLGSSHRAHFHGACVADYSAYATPLGQVAVDTEICRALAEKKLFKSDRDTMRFEHALENQLPFLQKSLGISGFKIVPLLFGALEPADFSVMAGIIAPYINEHTLVVASSDLTHFGENFSYTPFRQDLKVNLNKLDRGFIEPVLQLDFDRAFAYHEKTGITVCGFVPIGVMIKLFEKKNLRGFLADYSKSGDSSGDYTLSVSYASMLFCAEGPAVSEAIGLGGPEKKLLLELARSSIRARLKNKAAPQPEENQLSAYPTLRQKLGVFVTLRKNHDLRGCIGSIIGMEPLYQGVIANAVHAAVDDPRFPPLAAAELEEVEIEISVMTPLQPLADYHAIRLGTDGVILRDGRAQAVFLPQVAMETGWNLDQFLANLCLKAGLVANAYRQSRSLEILVFQAQVFSENLNRQ